MPSLLIFQMKRSILIIFYFVLPILFSCSSSKTVIEDQVNEKSRVYIFDDVTNLDSVQVADNLPIEYSSAGTDQIKNDSINYNQAEEIIEETEPVQTTKKYIIQLGAFSNRERAELFIRQNKDKLNIDMVVSYNEKNNLFLIQLSPFLSREEAENSLRFLKNIDEFRDAFIVSTEDQTERP